MTRIALFALLVAAGTASAQYRGGFRGGYRSVAPAYHYEPYTGYHNNGEFIHGLPNPLSNPQFNWWYHNGPRYWNGSAWMVAPMPSGYPYNYYNYGYYNPYAYGYYNNTPIYNNTIVNTVNNNGQMVADNDIHIYLPDPNAKVYVNGVEFPGFGTDRHLTVSNVVVGAKHEVTVKATWDGDGKPHEKTQIVHLDGTGHATLYWFDAK